MPSLAKFHETQARPMLAGFVRQIAGVFWHGTVDLEADAQVGDGAASELDVDLSELGSRLRPSHRPPAFATADYAPRWG